MRLFVSYARVDKPYCVQIVDTLKDMHEVWYDQRLYAGQQWWKEILRRLDWCEGFVYLLSPDSVASEYCRREFELAQNLGRFIFPVLIQDETPIPPTIRELQYADLSKGLTPDAVRILLSSTYMAERHHQSQPPVPLNGVIKSQEIAQPLVNPTSVVVDAAEAMENGQFDRAVYLLKQAKANGYKSPYINIEALLEQAESALARQTYLRVAEREYKQIVQLVKLKRTRKLGCEAFSAFQKDFPDYDPEGIAGTCSDAPSPSSNGTGAAPKAPEKPPFSLSLLEWCEIPAGMVLTDDPSGKGHRPYFVDDFKISKYPITNAQYQAFLDDASGYGNLSWWQYSPHAHNWRMMNPTPQPSRYKGDERPREMVSWYDALAFCHWLSARLSAKITLPTQHQWQRAARGDDARLYPWGNDFDKNLANTRESEIKQTSQVSHYVGGASPFGVLDMSGNVWEWCVDTKNGSTDIKTDDERAVMGGAFVGDCSRAVIGFHYHLNPKTMFGSIGFRVVQMP
ncbi:MAG: SUMF1/EgtB/PvdO family nonheme iron enzyme [Anaerolineae bacterium]